MIGTGHLKRVEAAAFSLVELSIVLVILGLLVGGVLSGRSLIRSAEIRGTLAQVDNLKAASLTFRDKYFYLPGDIPGAEATQLGLPGSPWGSGDGDGHFTMHGYSFGTGEANLFFVHLAQKGLISGSYTVCGIHDDTLTNGKKVSDYVLKAKLGNNNYLHVWSATMDQCHPASSCGGGVGDNWITLASSDRYCAYNMCGRWRTSPTLATMDAYIIDMKVDDGMPQSGAAQAMLLGAEAGDWAGGEYYWHGLHDALGKPTTVANSPSSANCYDNAGVAGLPQRYTTTLDNNTCAVSFKF